VHFRARRDRTTVPPSTPRH